MLYTVGVWTADIYILRVDSGEVKYIGGGFKCVDTIYAWVGQLIVYIKYYL